MSISNPLLLWGQFGYCFRHHVGVNGVMPVRVPPDIGSTGKKDAPLGIGTDRKTARRDKQDIYPPLSAAQLLRAKPT